MDYDDEILASLRACYALVLARVMDRTASEEENSGEIIGKEADRLHALVLEALKI